MGFGMDGYLKSNLDDILKILRLAYDCFAVISGHGKVRIGKCLHPAVTIKVNENDKILNKKISDFKDGEKINTLSWDFENNKIVNSKSEVIKEKKEKDFYEIILENGKRIICTKEHKLFVKRKNKVIELKLKDIKEGDELVWIKNSI